MRIATTALLAVTLAAGTPLAAQTTSTGHADTTFAARLAAFRSGDSTVDVAALRRSFTATSGYSPYDTDADDRKQRLFAALRAQDPATAARIADSALAANPFDADAHVGAAVAARARGDTVTAQLHVRQARAIFDSMESTGDGRSADHALFVISPSEEYSYLTAHGLRRSGAQALTDCNGHECDVLEVSDAAGGKVFQMFFDVSLATDHLRRAMEATMSKRDSTAPAAKHKPRKQRKS